MEILDPSVAQQIAQAAVAFQQQRTGHEPKSVAVVLSGDTLLITLHGALSPAEQGPGPEPGRRRESAGVSPAIVRQLFRRVAAGNQTNHRGRGARSDRGSRANFGHRGASLHDRHDGASVPPRSRRTGGELDGK